MGAWGGRQTRAKNLRYPRVPRELALFLAKPELARSCAVVPNAPDASVTIFSWVKGSS